MNPKNTPINLNDTSISFMYPNETKLNLHDTSINTFVYQNEQF